ncbi:hypothetical protein CTAYLR_006458 [Chrysophaeum taylorii]|uniref:Uncharacterized protein n=1 Tax=Chrysophaeum taylorii TaxID=2483200 RepID=A0AAD7UKS9_9STRA|nr:hypothetical protein CTAYLR_006458 [Chrysophaeum taylorii]
MKAKWGVLLVRAAAAEATQREWIAAWASGGRCAHAADEDCAWVNMLGPVDVSCEFEYRVGLYPEDNPGVGGPAIRLTYAGGSATLEPHTATPPSFASHPRLCFRKTRRSNLVLLLVANELRYVFRWWPFFVSTLAYADAVDLWPVIWIGELPRDLATTVGDECRRSTRWAGDPTKGWNSAHVVVRRFLKSAYFQTDRRQTTDLNSNHHVKMTAAYVVLDRPDVDAAYFTDIDVVADPSPRHRNTTLSVHMLGDVDVYFTPSIPFWRVQGSRFYVRDTPFSRTFLSQWLSFRCGFHDQYSLWHAVLTLASRSGCVDYRGEIFFNLSYSTAHRLGHNRRRQHARPQQASSNHEAAVVVVPTPTSSSSSSSSSSSGGKSLFEDMTCDELRHSCPRFGFCFHNYLNVTGRRKPPRVLTGLRHASASHALERRFGYYDGDELGDYHVLVTAENNLLPGLEYGTFLASLGLDSAHDDLASFL